MLNHVFIAKGSSGRVARMNTTDTDTPQTHITGDYLVLDRGQPIERTTPSPIGNMLSMLDRSVRIHSARGELIELRHTSTHARSAVIAPAGVADPTFAFSRVIVTRHGTRANCRARNLHSALLSLSVCVRAHEAHELMRTRPGCVRVFALTRDVCAHVRPTYGANAATMIGLP